MAHEHSARYPDALAAQRALQEAAANLDRSAALLDIAVGLS